MFSAYQTILQAWLSGREASDSPVDVELNTRLHVSPLF